MAWRSLCSRDAVILLAMGTATVVVRTSVIFTRFSSPYTILIRPGSRPDPATVRASACSSRAG